MRRFILAQKYFHGTGVLQDKAKAARVRQAADQGLANAQYTLCFCYEKGHGVPQDMVQAARLYRLATDQGHAEAQFNLAICYDKGEGVPQDMA
jgi:TPR repeat protein